jgi:glycosyltransferase involved in cell wall biosynthesis
MTLRASIVLCTFQGEKFLLSQLASLRRQTVQPFEVIAQDDGSVDATMDILKTAAADWPALRIFRNERNLGFAANFASAIDRASGDIIFPCDQDDEWAVNKLELMLAEFVDPSVCAVFCDAELVDERGGVMASSILSRNGIPQETGGGLFSRLLRSNPVPGNCLSFRASIREVLRPFPPDWEHDYWTLILVTGLGKKVRILKQSLVKYRQHQSQVIGGDQGVGARARRAGKWSLSRCEFEARRFNLLVERLRLGGASGPSLAAAEEKQEWLVRRASFPEARLLRVLPILKSLLAGKYHRFEAGLSSAVKDWLAPV